MPPHLFWLGVVIAMLLFFGLVWYFRRSSKVQQIVEETLGDDTPEAALSAYHDAVERLKRHRDSMDLDADTAAKIDEVLDRVARSKV